MFNSHFHSYEGRSGTVDLINIRFIYLIMSYYMSHELNNKTVYISLQYKPCCTKDFEIT